MTASQEAFEAAYPNYDQRLGADGKYHSRVSQDAYTYFTKGVAYGAIQAQPGPVDHVKLLGEIYGFLQSTCPEGIADEAFRTVPESLRAQAIAKYVEPRDEVGERVRHTPEAGRAEVKIKLDGKMVTPEQAASEWEVKKETHDLWYGNFRGHFFKTIDTDFQPNSNEYQSEYELRPKALKEVSGTGSRDDVSAAAVNAYLGVKK
jgi:hypothetical protein